MAGMQGECVAGMQGGGVADAPLSTLPVHPF